MEKRIEPFKEIYYNAMPSLIDAKFKPATAEEIGELILNKHLSFDASYDNVTGIFHKGNYKHFKIIPYCQDLANITKDTRLYDGGIKKTPEEYEEIDSQEFTRDEMIIGKRLMDWEVLEHPGWLASFDWNNYLLEKIVTYVFREVKKRCGKDTAMGFYLARPQKIPNIHAVSLSKIAKNHTDSFFFDLKGGYGLNENANLIGIYDGSGKTDSLETRSNSTNESKKKRVKEKVKLTEDDYKYRIWGRESILDRRGINF